MNRGTYIHFSFLPLILLIITFIWYNSIYLSLGPILFWSYFGAIALWFVGATQALTIKQGRIRIYLNAFSVWEYQCERFEIRENAIVLHQKNQKSALLFLEKNNTSIRLTIHELTGDIQDLKKMENGIHVYRNGKTIFKELYETLYKHTKR